MLVIEIKWFMIFRMLLAILHQMLEMNKDKDWNIPNADLDVLNAGLNKAFVRLNLPLVANTGPPVAATELLTLVSWFTNGSSKSGKCTNSSD